MPIKLVIRLQLLIRQLATIFHLTSEILKMISQLTLLALNKQFLLKFQLILPLQIANAMY